MYSVCLLSTTYSSALLLSFLFCMRYSHRLHSFIYLYVCVGIASIIVDIVIIIIGANYVHTILR